MHVAEQWLTRQSIPERLVSSIQEASASQEQVQVRSTSLIIDVVCIKLGHNQNA